MLPLSLALIAVLLQAPPPGRPYSEERQLLDRHLAQLARSLPNGPTPDEDAALLKQTALDSGLRNLAVGAPTITETGSLGQSNRSLTADSTFPDADRFFRAVQSSPRFADVDSLVLRSLEFGVHIEARVRLYHRPLKAVATVSLDPAHLRDRTRGATREEAARFSRDEQVALETSITLDDLRRRQTSPRMFLAETGASFRDAAAALTFGSFEGDTGRFTLRGVVAGDGSSAALERRLEEGFFRVREFSRAAKDGCYQFEVVGETYRAGPQAALPLPVDEPFRATEALCQQDRDSSFSGTPGATLRATGSGGVSLRAVDADLADVAAMLEGLSKEPFVVAEGVRGRINLELTSVSVDEALRVLPVRVDLIGGVRLLRINTETPEPLPQAEGSAPVARIAMRAKRIRGEDVFAAAAETDPAFVSLGPAGLPRVSVFAREALVSDIRRATLAASGLDEGREENVRVLRYRNRPGDVAPLTASAAGRVYFRARDLAVGELALAAIGRAADETTAFVYSPLGEIVALRVGDALADGFIAAIDPAGLLIDTAEGPVRISIAMVPNSSAPGKK